MCCRIRHCPASNSQFTDIIIAHDGKADSLKAIAPKPILVYVDCGCRVLVFNHYIFGDSYFHRIKKNVAQLAWLIVVNKIDVEV